LEEQVFHHNRTFASLFSRFAPQAALLARLGDIDSAITRLSSAFDVLRATAEFNHDRLSAEIAGLAADQMRFAADIARLSSSLDSGQARLSSQCEALNAARVQIRRLSADRSRLEAALRRLSALGPRPPPPPPGPLDSLIVPAFPDAFAEFRGKRFRRLWRGGADGFGADDFHARCDGHAGTVTLVLDTAGNIFGGFTPVAWDSLAELTGKGDESLRSFVFSIRNPHGIGARTFGLRAETRGEAIDCF
jgi:hypothetical protein